MKFQSDISLLSNITLDAIPIHRRWAALAGFQFKKVPRDNDADRLILSLRPERLAGHVLRVSTGLTPILAGHATDMSRSAII